MNLGSNLEEIIPNGVKLRFEPHFAELTISVCQRKLQSYIYLYYSDLIS